MEKAFKYGIKEWIYSNKYYLFTAIYLTQLDMQEHNKASRQELKMTNLVTSRMNDCHMGSGMNHERMSGDNM
jgi:hypothetical protein